MPRLIKQSSSLNKVSIPPYVADKIWELDSVGYGFLYYAGHDEQLGWYILSYELYDHTLEWSEHPLPCTPEPHVKMEQYIKEYHTVWGWMKRTYGEIKRIFT